MLASSGLQVELIEAADGALVARCSQSMPEMGTLHAIAALIVLLLLRVSSGPWNTPWAPAHGNTSVWRAAEACVESCQLPSCWLKSNQQDHPGEISLKPYPAQGRLS